MLNVLPITGPRNIGKYLLFSPQHQIEKFISTLYRKQSETLPPNAIFPPWFFISSTASTNSCTPDFVCIGPYSVFAEIKTAHSLRYYWPPFSWQEELYKVDNKAKWLAMACLGCNCINNWPHFIMSAFEIMFRSQKWKKNRLINQECCKNVMHDI